MRKPFYVTLLEFLAVVSIVTLIMFAVAQMIVEKRSRNKITAVNTEVGTLDWNNEEGDIIQHYDKGWLMYDGKTWTSTEEPK